MNYTRRKVEERSEKLQQRRDAGTVAKNFPNVSGIVIHMKYHQQHGIRAIVRTFLFSPSSYAFFRMDCLSNSCKDGGFELTNVIDRMIRNRQAEVNGVLDCEGTSPSDDCSNIAYDIAIKYSPSLQYRAVP